MDDDNAGCDTGMGPLPGLGFVPKPHPNRLRPRNQPAVTKSCPRNPDCHRSTPKAIRNKHKISINQPFTIAISDLHPLHSSVSDGQKVHVFAEVQLHATYQMLRWVPWVATRQAACAAPTLRSDPSVALSPTRLRSRHHGRAHHVWGHNRGARGTRPGCPRSSARACEGRTAPRRSVLAPSGRICRCKSLNIMS